MDEWTDDDAWLVERLVQMLPPDEDAFSPGSRAAERRIKRRALPPPGPPHELKTYTGLPSGAILVIGVFVIVFCLIMLRRM